MSEPGTGPRTGIGPLVNEAWGDAIPSLPRTWLAGVALTVTYVVATGALLVCVVLAAVAASAASALLLGTARGLLVVLLAGLSLYAVLITPLLVGFSAVLAPPLAASLQAHWRHLRDDVDLTLADGWRGGLSDRPLVAWLVLEQFLQAAGYLLFFVPGVVVDAALAFVAPARVVHGLPLGAALRRSVGAFLADPLWTLAMVSIDGLISLAVQGFLPGVGLLVTVPMSHQLRLRAYLEAFPAAPPPAALEPPPWSPDPASAEPLNPSPPVSSAAPRPPSPPPPADADGAAPPAPDPDSPADLEGAPTPGAEPRTPPRE